MNSLKVGNVILMGNKSNRRPCKVIEINKATPGKHGHAQYNVVGRDFITEKKVNELFKHHDHYTEVSSNKRTYTGIEYNGEYLSVMDDDGIVHNDFKLPSKLVKKYEKHKDEFNITTIFFTWKNDKDETMQLEVVADITS